MVFSVNDCLDGLEDWFSLRQGNPPDGWYREDLECLNDKKGEIINPTVFETPDWIFGKYANRAETLARLHELHPDKVEKGDYIELAIKLAERGRKCQDMLIPV